MKKMLFGLFVLVMLVGCVQVEEKRGDIIELNCGGTTGPIRKLDLSCTVDVDCTQEKLEAFCSPDNLAIPTCIDLEFICDTDKICKAFCPEITI